MKKTAYIISMAVAMIFASCQKDADLAPTPDSDKAVAFSAESISPLTRVSGTDWEAEDAIGITMLKSADGSVVNDNHKYLASDDGATVSFYADSDIMYFLEDDSAVDFYAFYPYDESWSYASENMIFDISGQDGTQEGQNKADLLSSKNLVNQTHGAQILKFTHVLSKVRITVSNIEDLSAYENLDNLTATLSTTFTQYDAVSDERVSSDESKVLKMVKTTDSDDESKVIFTAIFLPGEVSDEISFTDGETTYTTTLAIENAESGYQYNYTAVVGDTGLSILKLTTDGITNWDGQGSTDVEQDIKIVDNVYQIYTTTGLELFAEWVNSGETTLDALLMDDINLDGSTDNQWTPIGTGESTTTAYGGIFDGGGHSITGLYVNGSSAYQALFGSVIGSTIKNLSVGGTVTYSNSYQHSGIIAGYSKDATFSSCTTLAYSSVSGGSNNVGGIAAYANGCSFIDCHNNASANGTKYVGGIVGYCSPDATTSLVNCSNSAKIYSSATFAGGIVGKMFGTSSFVSYIINCSNSGAVEAISQYAGGLAGSNQGGAIYNSYTTGNISGSEYVGGIVGIHDLNGSYKADMLNCYATGSVSGTTYVGGVAGYNNGATIDYAYYNTSNHSGSALGDDNGTSTNIYGNSQSMMQNSDFVLYLNNNAYTYNLQEPATSALAWKYTSGDYPQFDHDNDPTGTIVSCTALGSGTASDPYIIENTHQMRDIRMQVSNGTSFLGKYFEMQNDICLDYAEWSPIGDSSSTAFQGTFNGGGYSLTGMTISSNSDQTYGQGLFGYISNATIKNLKVGGSVAVTSGVQHVALIVGGATDSNITSCETISGSTVSGSDDCTAGIVGYNVGGTIKYCINRASISGEYATGGITGYVAPGGSSTIFACENYGDVSLDVDGANSCGGIVGVLRANASIGCLSIVVSCINQATINGNSMANVGGIAGNNQGCHIYNSYSAAAVSGASGTTGGVVGSATTYNSSAPIISWCYFDGTLCTLSAVGYSNDTSSVTGAAGISTSDMQGSHFTAILNNGVYAYNQTSPSIAALVWSTLAGGYPTLVSTGSPTYTEITASCTELGDGSKSKPYIIASATQLRDLSASVSGGTTYSGKYIQMVGDINLNSTEFTPIGATGAIFYGIFDGGGFEVSGLYINQPESSNQGLFGYISGTTISNVGVNGSVKGKSYVAGVVGYAANSTTIKNCYNKATITAETSCAGGILGATNASATNTKLTVSGCYNSGDISGISSGYTGGIIGDAYQNASITNCYNRGAVSGANYIGGIAGRLRSTSDTSFSSAFTMTNCYNAGSISGSYTGATVGYISRETTVSNFYYNSSLYSGTTYGYLYSAVGVSVSATPKTPAEMTNGSFASSLSSTFKEDDSSVNGGYPILTWQK